MKHKILIASIIGLSIIIASGIICYGLMNSSHETIIINNTVGNNTTNGTNTINTTVTKHTTDSNDNQASQVSTQKSSNDNPNNIREATADSTHTQNNNIDKSRGVTTVYDKDGNPYTSQYGYHEISEEAKEQGYTSTYHRS